MNKQRIAILGLYLLLSSCDKESRLEYFVENRSSTTIEVQGVNRITVSPILVTLEPGENQSILTWRKLGKEEEAFQAQSVFDEGFLILNAFGDTCQLNPYALDNWVFSLEESRSVASHDYTLFIGDEDF